MQALFAPTSQFGFRKNYQPGHYNMRFKPSQGLDGVYVGNSAPYHGPDGAEPVSFSPYNKSLIFANSNMAYSTKPNVTHPSSTM